MSFSIAHIIFSSNQAAEKSNSLILLLIFPYIASCSEPDRYAERFVPWHWHKAVELFYMETGTLKYHTPKGEFLFPAASGGMVNSNVLHMTKPQTENTATVQLLHIFDPSFISGEHGSRIEQKYVLPLITAPQLEIISLYPDNQQQRKILNLIQNAFHLSEEEFGYEIKLREILSEIWISLFQVSSHVLEDKGKYNKTNDKIKLMMIYIHEHYMEKIYIPELASAAYLSERECFRVFHDCGLGSSSYFGKVFREYVGCSPMKYRLKWQNSDI